MEIEFVVLANSYKDGGRCVAGICTDTGEWIRPVSTSEGGALGSGHYQIPGFGEIPLLAVVRADLEGPSPLPGQPENWLVSKQGWTIVRQMSPLEASFFLQPHFFPGSTLFGNTSDCIPESDVRLPTMGESLVIVEPRNLRWEIRLPGQYQKRQTRALFDLSGQRYNLSATDPVWAGKLGGLSSGEHPVEEDGYSTGCRRYFTISLGGPFKGDCYKLVAGVIPLP